MELILEQFDDLLVKILLLAAIISFVSMPADEEMGVLGSLGLLWEYASAFGVL